MLGVSERIGTRELREVFEKYGHVLNVQTGQAGFAFIEMEEERDCYECIRALDNSLVDGQKIIVEKAREKSHQGSHIPRNALFHILNTTPRHPDSHTSFR